jgi:endo-1,4-beta-xylanase
MKNILSISLLVAGVLFVCSCHPEEPFHKGSAFPRTSDAITLASAGEAKGVNMGVGISYQTFMNTATYADVASKEFKNVTFGYHMKHGAIVGDDGNLNFGVTDGLVAAVQAKGLGIYGHTLVWHHNNNGNYLRGIAGGGGQQEFTNIISNGDFETDASGWSIWNGDKTQSLHCTNLAYVYQGNGCMQFVNASDNPGGQWKGQINKQFDIPVVEGHVYQVTFFIRCLSGSGSGRCSTSGTAHYQGDFDVSADYKKITWEFTAAGGETGLCFDMGARANTYFVDNVKVIDTQEEFEDPNAPVELIPNGSFEKDATGWTILNGDKTQSLYCTDVAFVYKGKGSMQFVNATDNPGSQWKGQIKTSFNGPIIAGDTYQLSFYIRCATGTGSGRCSTTGNAQYQGDFEVTTEYRKITWEIVGKAGEDGLCFDMGARANTYYIDEIKLVNQTDPSNGTIINNEIPNGTFEVDAGGWAIFNGDKTQNLFCADPAYIYEGNGSLQFVNATDNPGSQWKGQINTPFVSSTLTEGEDYILSFYIRCKNGSGSGRCSTTGSAHYQGDFDVSTDYKKISWEFSADGGETGLCFDLGAKANTYYIDNVVLKLKSLDQGDDGEIGEDVIESLDAALNEWITSMVTKYKGVVAAWDVVNEPMADGNSGVRSSVTDDQASEGDIFYWQDYLGRDYAVKAFEYAHAANPDALLFINDYNLEYNPVKLDSLLAFVQEVQAKLDANGNGARIHGIGTQMHTSYMAYAGIAPMFEKLAATGLLIKVSELEVKLNTGKNTGYVLTEHDKDFQGAMYEYIMDCYLKYVPQEQRYGFTIWGINDGESWVNEPQKGLYYYPLLWDDEFKKKPAYYALMKALGAEPEIPNIE